MEHGLSRKSCLLLLLSAACLVSVATAQPPAAPCNWLDCVAQPVPPPAAYPTPQPSPTAYPEDHSPEYNVSPAADPASPTPNDDQYPSPSPPVETPSPVAPAEQPPAPTVENETPSPAAPVEQPSPVDPQTPSPATPVEQPSPVDPQTPSPAAPVDPAPQPSVPYSPVIPTEPVPAPTDPQPAAPLCSNPPPDPSPVNNLAKWCEMDAAKLYFKPQAVKPRFFPGTTFKEGFGSPSMNETHLKVEYYGEQGRYVLNAAYDSGDDKPYASIQLDLTLGLLQILPFAFNKNGRQQAVLNYDLRTLDPSFFVALSTRDGFKSAFAPVSEAFEFLDRILQRFQSPYNPSPDIGMPMKRGHYCPELASVSLYLREIRGTVGL